MHVLMYKVMFHLGHESITFAMSVTAEEQQVENILVEVLNSNLAQYTIVAVFCDCKSLRKGRKKENMYTNLSRKAVQHRILMHMLCVQNSIQSMCKMILYVF
jgi:hypothetical protein